MVFSKVHSEMYYQSPIGLIKIIVSEGFINELMYLDEEVDEENEDSTIIIPSKNKAVIETCKNQFDEYFSGERKTFHLPIKQSGTVFQEAVWKALLEIPFGKTISYLQLARNLGNVKAIRAVGTSNGKNKLSIVVPCHRVIGSDGSLTGYAGGLWRKQWLLEHENKYANGVNLLF